MESERPEGIFNPINDAQHSISINDSKHDINEASLGYAKGFLCTEKFTQSDAFATMSAIGDVIAKQEMLVVLLGSLSEDYEPIPRIIFNFPGIDLMSAREMPRREWDNVQEKEIKEVALMATREKYQKTKSNKPRATRNVFNGNCFHCGKRRHKKDECFQLSKENERSNRNDHAFMAITAQNKNDWLLDSGASCHMSYDKAEFTSMRDLERPVKISIANGTTVEAMRTGSIAVSLSNGKNVTIHDVLYVPYLDRRLLSIPAFVSRGLTVSFGNNWCEISSGYKMIIRIKRSWKMYILKAETRKPTEYVASLNESNGD
uniref:Putative polyprotein n=1 Tax=Albugo laibachii Nc14 TaxID=890382 RepID=F0W8W1_9STRA|nr:putative polyprotein [Albugo laibachii Nc14]|eukprot:CCA17572.1 putative polyprotein [Albugo laibachii Nc14]